MNHHFRAFDAPPPGSPDLDRMEQIASATVDVEPVVSVALDRLVRGDHIGNPLYDLWRNAEGQHHGDEVSGLWLPSATGVMVAVKMREATVPVFAWAVPDEHALKLIASVSPNGVVEIGAGTGYWARVLWEQTGTDTVAYDAHPFDCDCGTDVWWCRGSGEGKGDRKQAGWWPVERGGPEAAGEHPDRTLLLVWPPYNERVGADAIRAYHAAGGRTVIHVGEPAGGCTGDQAMHRILGEDGEACEACDHIDSCDGTNGPFGLACVWGTAHSGHDPEACDIGSYGPLYEREAEHGLPQWSGLHDIVQVFKRRGPLALPAGPLALTPGDPS